MHERERIMSETEKILKEAYGKRASVFVDWADRFVNGHLKKKHLEGTQEMPGWRVEESSLFKELKVLKSGTGKVDIDDGLLVGTVRMGYGHYRMALSVLTYALRMGSTPYWLDFRESDSPECRVLTDIDKLYSGFSRWTEKNFLLEWFWENITSSGGWDSLFLSLRTADLVKNLIDAFPRDLPLLSSYVLTAHTAILKNFKKVVHMIPDNYPQAFHIAPHALHLVQSPALYYGYLKLGVPEEDLIQVGHYVDYELVSSAEKCCDARIRRRNEASPLRCLFTIGGAGAQSDFMQSTLENLVNEIKEGQIIVLLNAGDHDHIVKTALEEAEKFNLPLHRYDEPRQTDEFTGKYELDNDENTEDIDQGIHLFHNKDVFHAVMTTNKLMKTADIMITKPSELSYYPIPILFLRRVGKHEAPGAVRAAELGTGTPEMRTPKQTALMLKRMLKNPALTDKMNQNVIKARAAGIYDGAEKAVETTLSEK